MARTRPKRVAALGLLAAGTMLLASCSAPANAVPPASVGIALRRPVPASIRHLPLTNQNGQAVTLSSWPGKTVLLVPFLTLCQEVCPMTTGNLLQVQHALHASREASKVQIVELSVDPGRDTPARLAAYARLTGASWQLVTEQPAVLASVAKFFGFYYHIVTERNPPGIDWWTHQPLTYDVVHSDGFVVINPAGDERFVTETMPDFHGHLSPALYRFLDGQGHRNLAHPANPNWTPAELLQALGWSMGRQLSSR